MQSGSQSILMGKWDLWNKMRPNDNRGYQHSIRPSHNLLELGLVSVLQDIFTVYTQYTQYTIIPHICHFFSTGTIFGSIFLHYWKLLVNFGNFQWQSVAVCGNMWPPVAVSHSFNFYKLKISIGLSAAGAKADCAKADCAKADCALPTILS